MDEDDLDAARRCLEADVATEDEGVGYSLRAIAHTLLWQAEQYREYKRSQELWYQRQRENQPPPPMPYLGF